MALTAILRITGFLYLLLIAHLLSAPFATPTIPFSVSVFVTGAELNARDIVENWLLAIPFGILVGSSEAVSGGRLKSAVGAATALLLLVILPAEILQYWMPPRHASLLDVLMMLAGALTGVFAAWQTRNTIRCFQKIVTGADTGLPFALAIGWLMIHWIPNKFQLDTGTLQAGYAGLTVSGITAIPLSVYLTGAATWLAAMILLRQANTPQLAGPALVLSWIGLIGAPGRELSWAALLGGAAALLVFHICRTDRARIVAVTSLILMVVLADFGIAPSGSAGLNWVPFAEYSGTRKLEIVTRAVTENAIFAFMPVFYTVLAQPDRSRQATWTASIAAAILIGAIIRLAVGQNINATPVVFFGAGVLLATLQIRLSAARCST